MRFLSLQLSPRWKFLAALLLLASICSYTLVRSLQIQEQLEDVWEVNNAKAALLLDMRLSLRGAVLHLEAAAGLVPRAAQGDDLKQMKEALTRYLVLEAELGKSLSRSKQTKRNEVALVHKIGVDRNAFLQQLRQVEILLKENQTARAIEVITKELRPGPLKLWLSGLDELIVAENEANALAGEHAGREYEQLRTTVLLLSALVVVLGLFSLWLTIKRNAGEAQQV